MASDLPFRQIHLDFHTSEDIPNIGASFDPDRFASTLKEARVDSIVLFAKCHHGWSYYDTAVGRRHPNLGFDLLKAQVEACRSAGIRYTIYISVGWDELAARENPGWRRVLPDGSFEMVRGKNLDPYWSYLCCNTPYLDYICDQVSESLALFDDADGVWLDIIRETPCCCTYCRAGMDAEGLDWTKEEDQATFARAGLANYFHRTREAAHSVRPTAAIFHNAGMVPRGDLRIYDNFSHVEIEALPTGGWGYDHFPLSARYIDAAGFSYMGVTGRFHYTWGELGGLKHPNALRSEIGTMLMHGGRICIGDHLDPSGALDADVYRAIGDAYREIFDVQPEIDASSPIADVGLLSSVGVRRPGTILRDARSCLEDEGALRILQQGHILFDTIDQDADFSRYKLIILPDRIRLSPTLAARLEAYRSSGGALLLSYESGLAVDSDSFALPVGGVFVGRDDYSVSYVQAEPPFVPEFMDGLFSIMAPATAVEAREGKVAATFIAPYFERTKRHFSGHQHAPAMPEATGLAALIQRGSTLYYAHEVFSQYRRMGQVALKNYILNGIRSMIIRPTVVATTLPSTATVTLRRAATGMLLQLQYAPREARGDSLRGTLEIIEDLPALADNSIALDLPDFDVSGLKVVHGDAVARLTQAGSKPVIHINRFSGHVVLRLTTGDCLTT